jgi:hypothetical protein
VWVLLCVVVVHLDMILFSLKDALMADMNIHMLDGVEKILLEMVIGGDGGVVMFQQDVDDRNGVHVQVA